MNRLELATANVPGRFAAWIVVIAVSATTHVSAQFTPQFSEQTNAGKPQTGVPLPAASQSSPPKVWTIQQGTAKLAEVSSAIQKKDFVVAVESYRALAEIAKQHPQLQAPSVKLKQQLMQIGFAESLLSLPPRPVTAAEPVAGIANAGPMAMPQIDNAVPMAQASGDVSADKAEALRLVAIGRAALDRGDASTAMQMARRAESLRVPETAFHSGEPRVWQLLLDAESAAKRSGVALTSGVMPADGNSVTGSTSSVQPAYGTSTKAPGEADNAAIAQMLFNGQPADQAGSAVAQVQFEPAADGLSVSDSSAALDAYQAGLLALSQGDRSQARAKFLEAWQSKDNLTPAEQSQLQDKLTLLQPKRLVPEGKQDEGELSPIEKAQLEAEAKTRRLYREVTSELANAEQRKEDAPLDALDDLERLRRRVDGSDIDDRAKQSLVVLVDRAIRDQKVYIDNNRAEIDLDIQNAAVKSEMAREDSVNAAIDEQVSSFVNDFNQFMSERRFHEAEVVAKQVAELKPDTTIAKQMLQRSRMGTRLAIADDIKSRKELSWLDNMADIDLSSIGPNPDMPMTLPDAETWQTKSLMRLGDADGDSRLSPAEQEIKNKLSMPVNIRYKNRPLGEVMDDLSAVTGVPIYIDQQTLNSVRVTTESPVTLELNNPIMFKNALNLLLQQNELAYMIKHDVLMITTRAAKESNVEVRTYRVTDLVTPIPNFVGGYEQGLAGALRAAYQMTQPQADVQLVPVSMTDVRNSRASLTQPGNSMSAMNSQNPNVLGQYNPMGAQSGYGPSNPLGGAAGGGAFADFQSLIDLIQTTVNPETWEALGGPSTMREYQQNLSLVISTTSDVHDQITDLLESLRRLQSLQITIEVRFITLSDTFAEQIGVDFDFQADDNTRQLPDEDEGPSVTVGWNGQGFTPDLDISFNNTSFAGGLAPAFGGANLGEASSLGFAILSDIEAFFFIQAIQTDNRTNVMQAPKVTLFDGQIASINDTSQTPFVTSITPVVGDFAVAQQPVIVVLNEGTSLNVQGIVSDDKRFVRLTLVPFFSQIGDVDTFTYEGSRRSTRSSRAEEDTNGDGVVDEDDAVDTEDEQEIISGTTVQLPTFAFTQVSTTVSVPDGGTILLGGIKRLAEGRAERGVPMLSKIPYLSRLFRNVSVGRDASSLMLMVTPRIIIQEEEEYAQTGFDPDRR